MDFFSASLWFENPRKIIGPPKYTEAIEEVSKWTDTESSANEKKTTC